MQSKAELARLAIFILSFTSSFAFSADLNPPPSITTTTTGETSVSLAWTVSPAIRGKTTYTVLYCQNLSGCSTPVTGTSTKKLSTAHQNLTPSTPYYFQISARDAAGNTALSEWSDEVVTLDSPGGGACNYPAFSDPPGSGGSDPFVKPTWAGDPNTPVFADEFNDLDVVNVWRDDLMTDALNRAGNKGIDENGNVCILQNNPYCAPNGKRWSAWYNENLDTTRRAVAGNLEMGGLHVNDPDEIVDPTRPGSDWKNHRLSTAFLTTWGRVFDENINDYVESPIYKNKWTAPMYLETSVSFEQMNTPGFRLSMWLMPATYDQQGLNLATYDEAYNGNFSDGFELDIFEYEPWTPDCGNLLEFSWINSFATKGKSGRNANGKNHFEGDEEGYLDIGVGYHTFGLLWETNRIQWVFNGEVVLEIDDPDKIPDIFQYLIISREMTNGITSGDDIYDANDTLFLPPEPGLYGWAGGSNVGNYFNNVNDDKAVIDYVRVYKP